MEQGKLIRAALLGFPLGLILLGAGSMIVTQLKPDRPDEDPSFHKRMAAASLNRKEINRDDLESFVSILSDDIGERNLLNHPGALERAAVWLQSTLQGGNAGYQVRRQSFHVDGHDLQNLIAELPGRKRIREVIVVAAHYDSPVNSAGKNNNATGVAAVLSLARAFAGDQQSRTLRFCFFPNRRSSNSETGHTGLRRYFAAGLKETDQIVAMLEIDSIGVFGKSKKDTADFANQSGANQALTFFGAGELSRFKVDSAKSIVLQTTSLPVLSSFEAPEYQSYRELDFSIVVAAGPPKLRNSASEIDFDNLELVCKGFKRVVTAWANP